MSPFQASVTFCARKAHPDSVEGEGFKIDRIALTMEASITGVDEGRFQELAQGAKQNCPLSKALASVPEITLQARLRS